MSENPHDPSELDAERIRAALIRAALDGYEQAALSGLCCEGAWEAAVSAMRRLELRAAPPGTGERGDRV
ncbi:MAG TPA: hypothetical protein VFX42_01360 [Gemmatimonadales bacterium]|nr:hypothetical protein [Gemmatimonadales bacterium]